MKCWRCCPVLLTPGSLDQSEARIRAVLTNQRRLLFRCSQNFCHAEVDNKGWSEWRMNSPRRKWEAEESIHLYYTLHNGNFVRKVILQVKYFPSFMIQNCQAPRSTSSYIYIYLELGSWQYNLTGRPPTQPPTSKNPNYLLSTYLLTTNLLLTY